MSVPFHVDPYVTAWSRAFALTVAVELPIAAFLLRRAEPRVRRRLALIAFANLASHPAVWFVFPELGLPFVVAMVLAELWAFGSEALFYGAAFERAGWLRAIATSALANAMSLGVGLLLRRVTGWV